MRVSAARRSGGGAPRCGGVSGWFPAHHGRTQPRRPGSRLQYRDDVPRPASRAKSTAQQLLDAQVGYHLERWSDAQLSATVGGLAEGLLAAGERHQIEDLVDREAIRVIVVRAMESMPASAAVSGILELVTAVLVEGPAEPYPLGELVDRDQVDALLNSVLALHPVLERLLEALADVPMVGTTASPFMGRIIHEVVQANKAVTDKVPADVLVDGFFDGFGGYTPTELLDQLDLTKEDLVADLVRLAAPVVGALRESGDLDRLLRAHLEPFFTSAEVTRLLG